MDPRADEVESKQRNERSALMHFDGTITLGNILTILAVLWPILRFTAVIRDFPPHRHTKDGIIYPKGMSPDREK